MEGIKRSYYAIIPATIRYDKNITANAKLLYGEITALCNEKGFCWATDSYFTELYGVSRSTIQRWFIQLEKNGYIRREVKYHKGTRNIEHRYTYLCDNPIPKNETTPMPKNETENNTVINNTVNNTKEYIPYAEIIKYLNEKAEKNYKHTASKTKQLIKARWNEGHTLSDFKKVIDICCSSWKGKDFGNGQKGDMYLRPSTLFNGKFNERLNWSMQKSNEIPVNNDRYDYGF
jgi:uncharacterized phage protein (TIGR02220 family)